MSADLFAAFGDSFDNSGSQQKQQQQGATNTTQSKISNDPFSFLTSTVPPSVPQALQQPSSSWQTGQIYQTNQQGSTAWNTAQLQAPQHNTNVWGDLASFGPTQTAGPAVKQVEDDDDGWGDFEVAAPQQNKQPPVPLINTSGLDTLAAPVPKPEPSPRTRIMRAPTLDLIANKLVDFGNTSSTLEPWQQRPSWEEPSRRGPKPKPPQNKDPNVLFDADDFDGKAPADEDEDDFGDFESVAPQLAVSSNGFGATSRQQAQRAPAPAKSAVDLLSAEFASTTVSTTRKPPPSQLSSTSTLKLQNGQYPQAPKSPSFQERNPFPGLGLTTPKLDEFPKEVKEKSPSPITAWPEAPNTGGGPGRRNSLEEDWAQFGLETPADDRKPKKAPTKVAPKKPAPAAKADTDWDWDAWDKTEAAEPAPPKAPQTKPAEDKGGPPPTNVPPPSVLLSLFPELLNLANTSLFKPLGAHPPSIKDRVLSDPATITFLRGYLAIATVAARIIAGRKLRWHRDKFLAQGMTISAAAAGGKGGGMKLAGLDKSQSTREDREAADVVAVWKENVGRLRGAVAAANAVVAKDGAPPLKVPELSDGVAVQTAKGVPTAPKACAVCGLRREERVPRVDGEVEDSFGEWWVEFWGHRACRNFWVENEVKLRRR